MTLPTPDDMLALGALFGAPDGPRPGAAPARRCRRHEWSILRTFGPDATIPIDLVLCAR